MDKLPLGIKLLNKNDIVSKIKMVKNICLLSYCDFNSYDCLKFKLIDDNFTVSDKVIELNYWYQLKHLEFGYLLHKCEKIYLPDERYISIFDKELSNKFVFYGNAVNYLPQCASQINISDKIMHVKNQIQAKFNLTDYTDINKPVYLFGIYNRKDLSALEKHKNDIYIIFGGSDLDYNMFHCKILIPKLINFDKKIKKYYVISENLKKRAIQLKIPKNKIELIRLDLSIDNNIVTKFNKKIYVYDGYKKTGKLYRRELIDEVLNMLPINFEIIYSSELDVKYNDIYQIYQKCFIGLRLTEKDGNANTVIEMGKLGIPVIFNGDEINAISYDGSEDIVNKIMDWYNILENLCMFD